jgi:hypothetical protein
MTQNIQNLLQRYDEHLKQNNPEMTWHNLRQDLEDAGVGRADKPFTHALRPRFLSNDFAKSILERSSRLAKAALRFCEEALREAALLDAIGLSKEEQEWARFPAPPGIGLTRLDGFVDQGKFRIVEWNGGCPAGGAYLDQAVPAFQKIASFQHLAQTHAFSYQACSSQVLQNLLDRYYAAGGAEAKPTIAVVDFAGLSTADEHELFRQRFVAAGYSAHIVTPEQLEFRRGALFGPQGKIDIVYRRLVTRDYLPVYQKMPALFEAAKAGATVIVDPFRAEVVHKKSFLAILSDPQYHSLFTNEEQSVISDFVPWTRRMLAEKTTDAQNKVIDLVEYAQRHQEGLVLKPIDNYGGKGVILGWETSSEDWEQALSEAIQNKQFVLQQRVATPRSQYPVGVGEKVEWQELLEDLCPYLAEDKAQGFLCRATSLSLGNVSAGANALPVFTF